MDSPEENGTIIVDTEEEFWLLQVMAIHEVDSGRRKGCLGFKKNLGRKMWVPCMWENYLCTVYLVSIIGNDWSKMKKTGKGLQKLGLNWSQESMFDSFEWAFGCFYSNWVGPNK